MGGFVYVGWDCDAKSSFMNHLRRVVSVAVRAEVGSWTMANKL